MAAPKRRIEDAETAFLIQRLRWSLRIFGPDTLSRADREKIALEVMQSMNKFVDGTYPPEWYLVPVTGSYFEVKASES